VLNGQAICHARGKRQVHKGLWLQSQKDGDFLEDQCTDGWIVLKCIVKRVGCVDWICMVQDEDK
jgi:hypothetical protein